nr:hypothetical protein [Kofleriaceae bacterium]
MRSFYQRSFIRDSASILSRWPAEPAIQQGFRHPREVAMSSVLVVNEISSEREEITRALEAEGFTVVQAGSAAEAVREIWGGSFIVAVISTLLTGTTSTALQGQLGQMAPEIETLVHGKNDEMPALVRKVMQIRDGSFSMGAA